MSNQVVPNIREFYSGKTLFVTGATGFVGKVLVEKLLFSCPAIKKIYVLVREKKGSKPEARIDELINGPAFASGRLSAEMVREKLIGLTGNLSAPGLGLSKEDRKVLTEEAEIVFHAAASIRFDEPLKNALNTNLQGTISVVQLCHEMKQLVSLVHVSTCYSNSHLNVVEEQLYPMKISGNAMLETASSMDNEDELEAMAVSKFYEGRPNSYTFTKALAEDYVHGNKGRLPVSIARLSIVISAISEPEPGFCDTPSAATLVLFLVGLGGLRTYRWKPEIRPNCIHADVCINSLIAIGWETATEHNSAKVFNVAASPEECYPQPFYFAGSTIVTRQFPSTTAFRYPASMLTPDGTLSYLYHKYVSELLFCILYDALMWICGKKSGIASKMRFLHKTRESLEPFHHTQWTFVRDNCDKLFAKLTDDERAIFKMEAGAVDFPRFCMDSWASLKKYKLKEDLTKVDQARRKMSL